MNITTISQKPGTSSKIVCWRKQLLMSNYTHAIFGYKDITIYENLSEIIHPFEMPCNTFVV